VSSAPAPALGVRGLGARHAGEDPLQLRHRERWRQVGDLLVVLVVGVTDHHRGLVFAQRTHLEQLGGAGQFLQRPSHSDQ
jgi:hypothetical protein